ncbi:MAG: homoserine O-succinyltransferase MetX [Wenzhouxiangella sp.]
MTPPIEDGQMVVMGRGMSWSAERVNLRYRLIGRAGAPVLLSLGGISADRCVDRWWSDLLGPGRAFDPDQYRLLSIDWLSRDDGQAVLTKDQAIGLARLLDGLGIDRIQDFIGASYGAMVGLAFAAEFPQRIERLIAISGPHRAHPISTARRIVQREMLRLGAERDVPERGLALARALALTTYRPPALFEQRFDQDEAGERLKALQDYLRHVGVAFAGRFDLARYLSLSESMDLHQVDPGSVRCTTHLVAVDSDELVPLAQLEALAGAIAGPVRLHRVHSVYGHDAFLKEPELFNRLISRIVSGEACHAVV